MESNAAASSLEDLIRNQDIEFYSYGKQLKTDLSNFGKYNWDLVKHILSQSGDKMAIKGKGLESYLTKVENLYCFANFLTQFWCERECTGMYHQNWSVHVDVDINQFSEHYQQPTEEKILNGLGQVVCDAASWVPEISYFEKSWNFALCSAVGGVVGYPGYEHPRDDLSFRREMARHAENFMIGSREQIKRYKKYALEYVNTIINLVDELKADPESIFNDSLNDSRYQLMGLQQVAECAERIAENVVIFSDRRFGKASGCLK